MSSVRNSRTLLTTATVAIAALSLTACNDGSGVKDEGQPAGGSSSRSPSASTPSGSGSAMQDRAKATRESTTKPTEDGSARKTTVASGKGGSEADDSGERTKEAVTCQGSNTKMIAAPLKRPQNHMLLTVTNTGSAPCHLYNYPAVRFGAAQAVPPVIEDSKPQAVVTLKPGESGYASVNLSATDGSGANGRTEKSLRVAFQGRTAGEDVPSVAHPALPAKGIYVDDSLKVTYWQPSMKDALSW